MSEPIAMVPTLAELLAEPERIDTLPAGAVAGLVVQLAGLQQRLGARLAAAVPMAARPEPADDLLDIAETARRLNMSVATLRNRTTREPWRSLRSSNGTRYVRFSAARIAGYLRGEPLAPTWPTGGPGSAARALASRRAKEGRGTA